MTLFDRLIWLADRLGKVEAGSPEADRAIHDTLPSAVKGLCSPIPTTRQRRACCCRPSSNGSSAPVPAPGSTPPAGEARGVTTASRTRPWAIGPHPGVGARISGRGLCTGPRRRARRSGRCGGCRRRGRGWHRPRRGRPAPAGWRPARVAGHLEVAEQAGREGDGARAGGELGRQGRGLGRGIGHG